MLPETETKLSAILTAVLNTIDPKDEDLLNEYKLLLRRSVSASNFLQLRRSVIGVTVKCGFVFYNGAMRASDGMGFSHVIEDQEDPDAVLDFLLKHEAEAERVAEIQERVAAAVINQQAPQTDFAPPEVALQANKPSMEFAVLAHKITDAVLGVLQNIPDGATVG